MTNDFLLFPESDTTDPDVSLVTAYLARELSVVQVIAFEERLLSDAEFRAKVQPLLDSWAAPVPSLAGERRPPLELGALDVEEGWRRLLREETHGGGISRSAPLWQRRSVRVAAVIGLTVLPMLVIAQVVMTLRRNAAPSVAPPAPAAFEVRENRVAVPLADTLLGSAGSGSQQQPSLPGPGSGPVEEQLPNSLTDAQFRALMASVSEPGGMFAGDVFVSNEWTVSRMAGVIAARHDTGGVYLGVGPEQNYTYIAASRPRLAFLMDIRRQAVMQHLMYKALFELAPDRADFVSLLFARPRPAGLSASSTIDQIWQAYMPARADTARARQTLGRIDDQLSRAHGIMLAPTDAALMRFVYAAFVTAGPTISAQLYSGDTLASRLAATWSDRVVSLIVEVRDSLSGASLREARVGIADLDGAFGGMEGTDTVGHRRLPPYPVGSRLRMKVTAIGYDSASVEERLDPGRPVLSVSLRRSARCILDAAQRRCIRTPPALGAPRRGGPPVRPHGFAELADRNFRFMTSSVDTANQPHSFLATEDNYRFVRSMHQRNTIVPVVADFGGPHAIRAIGQFLTERKATVTTFYISDVLDYLYSSGPLLRSAAFWDPANYAGTARAFWDNVATLPTASTSMMIAVGGTRLCPIGFAMTAGRAVRTSTQFRTALDTPDPNPCVRSY